MIDVTEKVKVEKELRENEAQLRELNKTKDRLFSIIGHDLRSPFNNILGFSDLLIKRLSKIYNILLLSLCKCLLNYIVSPMLFVLII